MSDGSFHSVAPLTVHRAPNDAAFVYVHTEQRIVSLSPPAVHVLGYCKSAKTLEGHLAVALRHRGQYSADETRIALYSLVTDGVLRPVLSHSTASPPFPPPASASRAHSVSVITADRPVALRRCLESLRRHSALFEEDLLVTVIDGSRTCRNETRGVVREFSRVARARYVGADEARTLYDLLAANGLQHPILREAITPGPIGASRNLSLLLSAGDHFITIDDDVVIEPWMLPGRSAHIAVTGHADLRRFAFYETRREAVSGLVTADASLLAAHQSILGQSVAGLHRLGHQVTLSHACQHTLSALSCERDPVVRLTVAGVAGDSGRYCPYRLLFASSPLRQLLQADHVAFTRALSSREVRIISTETVVSHDYSTGASYCMGIANRSLVPPFMPIGRGEDTLFAAMIAFTDPDALLGHLPYGIIHDSHRESSYGPGEMPSARHTRLCELLLYLVVTNTNARSAFSNCAGERLGWLGRLFCELGKLHAADFMNLVGNVALQLRCQALAAAQSTLGDSPDYWKAALSAYSRAVSDSVTGDKFLLPVELSQTTSTSEGVRSMQLFYQSFGELLQMWPDVWSAACRAEMRERFWDEAPPKQLGS